MIFLQLNIYGTSLDDRSGSGMTPITSWTLTILSNDVTWDEIPDSVQFDAMYCIMEEWYSNEQ